MLSFKQFIQETPQIVGYVAPPSEEDPVLGRHIDAVRAKKVSTLGNHDVYKDYGFYHLVDPNSGKILARMEGRHSGQDYHVDYVRKHPSYKDIVPFYKHLAIHHGLTLHSDVIHSQGSVNTYRRLADDPELDVRHVTGGKQEIHLHRGKDFHLNYGRQSTRFIVKKK